MIVEARVLPTDIDDVRVGQEANVHFSSVNPHGRSTFKGHVVTLSPTRVADGAGARPYFRAQIALDDAAGRGAGRGHAPARLAGLDPHHHRAADPVPVHLLAPFSDAMSRSFREE